MSGYGRSNGIAAYGRVANGETNTLLQIVLLYDGAIKFLHLAATDIEKGDIPARTEHANRAIDIVGYLQSILDFERGGEVAPALDALYSGVMMGVLQASVIQDAATMRKAADLLVPVRESWAVNAAATSSTVNSLAPTGPAAAGEASSV